MSQIAKYFKHYCYDIFYQTDEIITQIVCFFTSSRNEKHSS